MTIESEKLIAQNVTRRGPLKEPTFTLRAVDRVRLPFCYKEAVNFDALTSSIALGDRNRHRPLDA
jgi:hypothetical protein